MVNTNRILYITILQIAKKNKCLLFELGDSKESTEIRFITKIYLCQRIKLLKKQN